MNRSLTILFLFSSLNAQTSIGVHGGIATQHSFNEPNPHPSTWHKGAQIGAHVDYHLWNALSLSASAEYNFFRFNNYVFKGATIPEIRVVDSRGDNSHIYRIALEAKLTTFGPDIFRIQLVTGGAFIHENLGDVFITFEGMNSGTFTLKHLNKSKSYIAHSAGIGFQSYVAGRIGFEFLARYYSDYFERFDSSVNAGLIFRL